MPSSCLKFHRAQISHRPDRPKRECKLKQGSDQPKNAAMPEKRTKERPHKTKTCTSSAQDRNALLHILQFTSHDKEPKARVHGNFISLDCA